MLKHIVTVMGMLTILFGQFNIQGKGGYVPTQDNRSDCVSPQQRQEMQNTFQEYLQILDNIVPEVVEAVLHQFRAGMCSRVFLKLGDELPLTFVVGDQWPWHPDETLKVLLGLHLFGGHVILNLGHRVGGVLGDDAVLLAD